MNLVILDDDPRKAASYFCDSHLYSQIPAVVRVMRSALSVMEVGINVTFHDPGQITNPPDREPDPTHPWAVWAASARENYLWLADYAERLIDEYYRRVKNRHCDDMAVKVLVKMSHHFPDGKLQEFCQEPLPMEFRRKNDAIKAYRDWYANKASHLPTPFWPGSGQPPGWYFDHQH